MNKKIVWVITVFIIAMVLLTACGIKGNNNTVPETTIESNLKAGEEQQTQMEYEISKEIYTEGNVNVEYPQIINLLDKAKQNEINDLLKSQALGVYQKTVQELLPNQKYEVDGKFEIKYKSPKLLSIAYSSYNNIVPSAHPYNLFYTTNIDMETGKAMLLKDLVREIDKSFVNLLKKAKYVGEIEKEYEQQLADQAFSLYESDEKLIDALLGNGGDQDSIYAYITKNALGISLPVPHVMGDHVEFEISADDLKGNIIELD
ncbi:DUF4163 domain-containing protein [Desulfitobacterium sp. THU1]|uniref:PdaC/SigV domain-containing protein n=1 Tax=Desulfitobacterium sp. THU1 TaxID=3138072 RepID=UPI00311FE369